MSFTNVSETSAAAANQQWDTFVQAVEDVVKQHGPCAGADVLHLVSQEHGRKVWTSSYVRLGDCQRSLGAIRKTGKQLVANVTGKLGDGWEWVPDVDTLRLKARLDFWLESKERHTKEISRAEQVLARDTAMIQQYQAQLNPAEAPQNDKVQGHAEVPRVSDVEGGHVVREHQ